MVSECCHYSLGLLSKPLDTARLIIAVLHMGSFELQESLAMWSTGQHGASLAIVHIKDRGAASSKTNSKAVLLKVYYMHRFQLAVLLVEAAGSLLSAHDLWRMTATGLALRLCVLLHPVCNAQVWLSVQRLPASDCCSTSRLKP